MHWRLSVAFLSLALAVAAHGTRHRKSLGFGPINPDAVYAGDPYRLFARSVIPPGPDGDPFVVAHQFIDDVLGPQPEGRGYKIRPDSYTDPNTGITHVYVRQLAYGLEVLDGDMNINIKDGVVLSYGNSFYTSPALPGNVDASHPHGEYCNGLRNQLVPNFQLFQGGQQINMDSAPKPPDAVTHLFADHCEGTQLLTFPDELSEQELDPTDPRPALLHFMLAATPDSSLQEDIMSDYDSYLNEMDISSIHLFNPSSGDGITMVIDGVPDTVNPVPAKLGYIQVPSKGKDQMVLELVWKFEVEMQDNWYETAISASAPHKIMSVVDWASDASLPVPAPKEPVPGSYHVFPWGINDPSAGERAMMKENFDPLASPMGWHSIPYSVDPSIDSATARKSKEFWRNTTETWGNNVFAQENWEGANAYIDNYRPDAGASKVFNYTYAPKATNQSDAQDEAYSYINATVTQLFYTSNLVHDLYYRYGFDEVSGNFQQHNFGRGGSEGDAVIANAQDGSGYNNANFMTPPDGQNGRMRMYLWNTALPYRDGDFEAGIVIHELSHGLSTRLTGGPANSGCLGWGESGGMGEGWGDFLATSIRSTSTYSDFTMGEWAANRSGGIRNYPYSLNETVNPSTYKILDKPGYWGVHAIGEVWAEMLWIVNQLLIEKHGFSDNLFPPKPLEDGTIPEGDFYRPKTGKKPLVPIHGNTLMMQLVLNGMKLQPCRPSFFDARDAIILADQELTGGENFCELWKGFAVKGLGANAIVEGRTPWGGGIRTNGYKVPSACSEV